MTEERENGVPLYKEQCGECGSSDAKQVFEKPDGSVDGFCFACTHYFPPTGRTQAPPKPEKELTMQVIESINSLPHRATRGIREEIMKGFGVRVSLSPKDGNTIETEVYPDRRDGKVVGYEIKQVEGKKVTSQGDRKGKLELWGQHIAQKNGGKKLFITEGRMDAMSLYQCLFDGRQKSYNGKPSVVSITRGASSAVKDIMNNRDFVDSYAEVILVLDNDEAGKKATKEVLKVFPDFKVATLPLKDCNDMIQAGREKELYSAAMFNSAAQRQGEVLDIEDFIELALTKPKMGLTFPWPTVTKSCFGIRPNTIHVVGAAPKIGKTDHQHQLVEHLVYNEKVKVGLFDLENAPARTSKKLAGKHDRVDYSRPDIQYDTDKLRSTLMSMQGKVRFYDRSASRDWEDIRITIQEMHLLDGINIFIIDPLTALVSRFSSSEANDKFNEIMTDMADLVQNYPITMFCYSHVNPKAKGAKQHEAGGKVYSHEFTGSRALEKWSHYGHGISRDRTEDCPDDRKNMSEFRMLYDREFGQSYSCDVYFDEKTITYLEPKSKWST